MAGLVYITDPDGGAAVIPPSQIIFDSLNSQHGGTLKGTYITDSSLILDAKGLSQLVLTLKNTNASVGAVLAITGASSNKFIRVLGSNLKIVNGSFIHDILSLGDDGSLFLGQDVPTQVCDSSGKLFNQALKAVACRVTNSVGQTIGTGTWTSLTFDTNEYDTSNFHSISSNTSRFVAPFTGYYRLSANIAFTSSNAGTGRGVAFLKNGAVGSLFNAAVLLPPETVETTNIVLTTELKLNSGDYMEVQVWQNTGGNLNVLGENLNNDYSPIVTMSLIGV